MKRKGDIRVMLSIFMVLLNPHMLMSLLSVCSILIFFSHVTWALANRFTDSHVTWALANRFTDSHVTWALANRFTDSHVTW